MADQGARAEPTEDDWSVQAAREVDAIVGPELSTGEGSDATAECPTCGKTWLHGTCGSTVSRRALCAKKSRHKEPRAVDV